jgi:hypothetical protein
MFKAPVQVKEPSIETLWIFRLHEFLGDKLKGQELVAAAQTDDERAEAHYYVGSRALIENRPADARSSFQACVSLGRERVLETAFARARIEQIDSTYLIPV